MCYLSTESNLFNKALPSRGGILIAKWDSNFQSGQEMGAKLSVKNTLQILQMKYSDSGQAACESQRRPLAFSVTNVSA